MERALDKVLQKQPLGCGSGPGLLFQTRRVPEVNSRRVIYHCDLFQAAERAVSIFLRYASPEMEQWAIDFCNGKVELFPTLWNLLLGHCSVHLIR